MHNGRMILVDSIGCVGREVLAETPYVVSYRLLTSSPTETPYVVSYRLLTSSFTDSLRRLLQTPYVVSYRLLTSPPTVWLAATLERERVKVCLF